MDSNQNKCNTYISHGMLSMISTTQVEVSISLIGVLILWGLCIYGRVEHKLRVWYEWDECFAKLG